MLPFSDYARFYDLYYHDKNYAAEARFVLSLAQRFQLVPRTVLDMGCGTARHMEQFLLAGLAADGFDRSPRMLEQARARLKNWSCDLREGNLVSFANGRTYDLVVSLFAVMGYLTTNEELLAGLRTARRHLKEGGVFIFDGWFGPAVLGQQPVVRRHEYRDEHGRRILRVARPHLDVVRETVTVQYEVSVDGEPHPIVEEHPMRYFFVQEIRFALGQTGFGLEWAGPFLDESRPLGVDTWNVMFVARAE